MDAAVTEPGWFMRTMLSPGYPEPVRFSGRALFVTFTSEVDLRPWVPWPLEVADPRAAFLKVYRLKMRHLDRRPRPPAYSQYQQVCLTVLAAPPGQPLGHYNVMMWESRDWSVGPDVLGWRKKLAEIDMTATYPTIDRFDPSFASDLYQADVSLAGSPLLTVRARLDGTPGLPDPGLEGGFFSVSYPDGPPVDDDDREPRAEVTRTDVEDAYLGTAMVGTGSVSFHPSTSYSREENELVAALAEPAVTGVSLRDIGWLRPSTPPQTFVFSGGAVR